MSLMLPLTTCPTFFSVSIVGFEQVDVCWVNAFLTLTTKALLHSLSGAAAYSNLKTLVLRKFKSSCIKGSKKPRLSQGLVALQLLLILILSSY